MNEAIAKSKPSRQNQSDASNFEAPKSETPNFETPKFDTPKFDMPKFDMPKFEIPSAFREMAEKSVAQAKDNYEKMRTAAEDASEVFEQACATASKGGAHYALKMIEAARTNTNAAFDFFGELLTAKSLSEVVEVTSAHTRKQFEAFTAQSKELTAIAQKVAAETSEPIKSGVNKAFKVAA